METKPTQASFTVYCEELQITGKSNRAIGNMIKRQVKKNPKVVFVEYKPSKTSDTQFIMTIHTTADSCAENALRGAIDELTSEIWAYQEKLREALKMLISEFKFVYILPVLLV